MSEPSIRLRGGQIKHGHAKLGTPTYHAWENMIRRVTSTSGPDAKYYAERGITVCERWRKSFKDFLSDMGERPQNRLLDRWPNNDGNYEPGNCRWATIHESNRNRRANRFFEILGVYGCIVDLAKHFGIPKDRVMKRLRLGWDVERAFLAPKQH